MTVVQVVAEISLFKQTNMVYIYFKGSGMPRTAYLGS